MQLTENQQRVLDGLRKVGRENLPRNKEASSYLYQKDCERVRAGDAACVHNLGALSYHIGADIGLSAGTVLSTLKALEKKGLVIRDPNYPEYHRPRYWWPIGLAAELAAEIDQADQVAQ